MSTSGPADGEGDPFAEMAEVFSRFVNNFGSSPQLDFEQARQMAAGIANEGQSEFNIDPMHRIRVEQIARVAELHLADLTGLSVGSALSVEPVTRSQWTSSTLDDYRALFERLTESLGSIMRGQLDQISTEDIEELGGALGPLGADPAAFLTGMSQLLGPMMLSMMAGSTIGHLGRRAFGSYDLPIPRPSNRVMVVVHNVDHFSEEWSLPSDDVALWISLSELAHATVLGLPHVSRRMTELLARHAGAFTSDPTDLERRLGDVDLTSPEGMEQLQRLLGDPDVVLGAIRSDEQREIIEQIDTLVMVVVGYVDWAVDQVGSRLLSSSAMVTEALRRRRVETDQASRFIERLFGLELTQDKLDRGAAFVQGVADRGGDGALRHLWHDASTLPTSNEIDAPGLWLARVGLASGDQPLPELDEAPDIPDFPDL